MNQMQTVETVFDKATIESLWGKVAKLTEENGKLAKQIAVLKKENQEIGREFNSVVEDIPHQREVAVNAFAWKVENALQISGWWWTVKDRRLARAQEVVNEVLRPGQQHKR